MIIIIVVVIIIILDYYLFLLDQVIIISEKGMIQLFCLISDIYIKFFCYLFIKLTLFTFVSNFQGLRGNLNQVSLAFHIFSLCLFCAEIETKYSDNTFSIIMMSLNTSYMRIKLSWIFYTITTLYQLHYVYIKSQDNLCIEHYFCLRLVHLCTMSRIKILFLNASV